MNEIRSLIDKLNYYTKLYDEGHPAISDKDWDILYAELIKLEKDTGVIYPDSPTQSISYTVVNALTKVTHNHPMLSLDKTKSVDDVKLFVKNHDWIAMSKMDGLTCSLHYQNGSLISAETRGNGEVGEDILHNAKVVQSIPQHISFTDDLIVDGEIICTYKNFTQFGDDYKNPRNFASGSIRLLDSKECDSRHLDFVAWDVIKGIDEPTLSTKLFKLQDLGFTVVPRIIADDSITIQDAINELTERSAKLDYPIDGVVFKYNVVTEYLVKGKTNHHFSGGLAFKFYDEEYPSVLRNIEWSMGKTGQITPVAIFDPVEIDGTTVSRASLHNISVMTETLGEHPFLGEKVWIIKANMIIPQIVRAEYETE